MEQWEGLLEKYTSKDDTKEMSRLVTIAKFTLSKDLAPFEIEYFYKTLIGKPVNMIDVIKNKNSELSWAKLISDILKMLTDIVKKFNVSDEYLMLIAEVCTAPYDAQTNQHALLCLCAVASRSHVGVRDVTKYLCALELGATCRAQIATYIGTVCEFHPDVVADNINTIWRTFLNLIDTGKCSIPVVKAVLQGVRGILKHFGNELPMRELSILYEKLVGYLEMERCTDACVSILGEFPDLFRERLCRQRSVRERLWTLVDSATARSALQYVYVAMDRDMLQTALREVTSNAESVETSRKLTALQVMRELQRAGACAPHVADYVDVPALEYRLRGGGVTYDSLDTICWCIEANIHHSDRLLKAALMTYETIPPAKRRPLVIHGILKCAPGKLTDVIEFLIMETHRLPNKYMTIWKELFDSKNGSDEVVVTNADRVLKVFVSSICFILDGLEANDSDTSEDLTHLLRLVFEVLRSSQRTPCSLLARRLVRWSRTQPEAIPAALLACCGSKDQPVVNVTRFSSDESLMNCCVALVTTSGVAGLSADDLLKFLQVLFTWKNVDPSILVYAVQKLACLMARDQTLDRLILDDIFRRIQKIAERKAESKEDRILRRSSIEFLGKHKQSYNETLRADVTLMSSLRECLFLIVPENNGNVNINLNRMLHLAVSEQDAAACGVLVGVICATLSVKKDTALQNALYSVLAAQCVDTPTVGVVRSILAHCDLKTAPEFIKHISKVVAPDTRGMLLDGLESLLTAEQPDEQLLEEIMEQMLLKDSFTYRDSEISIVLLKVLKNNNDLLKRYIVNIIYKALNCNVVLTKMATDIFIDKIELFDKDMISEIILDVYRAVCCIEHENDKIIITVVSFLKTLMENNESDTDRVLPDLVILEPVNLSAFSCLKRIFHLPDDQCQALYVKSKTIIEKYLFDGDIHHGLGMKLEFIVEFSSCLINDDTITFIDKMINALKADDILKIERELRKFLTYIYDSEQAELIAVVRASVCTWISKLPLDEIACSLETYVSTPEHEDIVHALKVVVNSFEVDGLMQGRIGNLKRILRIIIKLYASGYVERCWDSKIQYLNDLVDLIMIAITVDEFKEFLRDHNCGIDFVQMFISGTYRHLIKEPYILLEPEFKDGTLLLNDVVKLAVKNRKAGDVVDLVDKVWHIYITVASFDQIHSLLVDLSCLQRRLPLDSNPMQWLLSNLENPDTKTLERLLLIEAIPSGEEYISAYVTITHRLPTRLDELKGSLSSYFRAILESFTKYKSRKLLDVIVNLASSTDVHGWWDTALEATIATLAADEDVSACDMLYQRCWEGTSVRACSRLLVPLLRFSKATFCEEFFSSSLPHLVSALERRPRAPSDHYSYHKYLLDGTRAFVMLDLLFQKVPRQSVESPSSRLYRQMTARVNDTQYWLVKTVCKLGLTLRGCTTSAEALTQKMKDSHRMFHCSIYNCVASALCCREPGVEVYNTMFDKKAWTELIGADHLDLPVYRTWSRRGASSAPPAPLLEDRLSATPLTRDFTRTLSEDPQQYDMLEHQVETVETPVGDNVLSRHECWSAMVRLFRKVATHHPNPPMQLVAGALTDQELHCNVKWLLAQVVCSCREELKPHAGVLHPALLDVVATTAGTCLNSVHVNILDAILEWHESELPPHSAGLMDAAVQHLVNTIVDHASAALYRSLLEKLDRLVQLYAGDLKINGSFFKDRITDLNSEKTKRCVQVLKRIAKAKICVPELVPVVMQTIEQKRPSAEVVELLGLALASGEHDPGAPHRLRTILRHKRSDVAEYIKILYYTHKNYPQICDETIFKVVSELVSKIVGRERQKCVEVMGGYVRSGAAQRESVEALPLRDLLEDGEGLELLKHCLPLINEDLRRELVLEAVKYCDSPDKERLKANAVVLAAFELLVRPQALEPPPKKRVECSYICSAVHAEDAYVTTVMRTVAGSLRTNDVGGADDVGGAYNQIGALLSTDVCVRFCEACVLGLYYPMKDGNVADLSGALGTCLVLFFNGIKQQQKYMTTAMSISDGQGVTSKGPTSSRLSLENLPPTRRHDFINTFAMQTLDQTLDEILKYALLNPSAAVDVCSQLVRMYRGARRPGFHFDETMYDVLVPALENVCDVTPYIMELIRALGYWKPSLKCVVDDMSLLTISSEGQGLGRVFKEEFELHTSGPEHLVMGSTAVGDKDMDSSTNTQFSIEGLVSAFDRLSDWDTLTMQLRNKLQRRLPPLFVDNDTFRVALDNYKGVAPAWFADMVRVYRGGDLDRVRCCRRCERWPRRAFDASATFEALDWQSVRDGADVQTPSSYRIQPEGCVAKWAARVMLKRAQFDALGTDERCVADVLALAQHSVHTLPALTVACCSTLTHLSEVENITVHELKVSALRRWAADSGEAGHLRSALQHLQQFKELVSEEKDAGISLRLVHQTLLLNREMKFLSKSQLESTLNELSESVGVQRARLADECDVTCAAAACALAVTQLDGYWERSDTSEKDDLVGLMCQMVNTQREVGAGERWRHSVDVIASRLGDYSQTLGEDTARRLVQLIKCLPDLDEFIADLIKSAVGVFPRDMQEEVMLHMQRGSETMDKLKKYFQLVVDVEHLLRDYCRRLGDALSKNDERRYTETLTSMRERIFDNPHAGPDHRVLHKYKRALYNLDAFEPNNEETKKRLSEIVTELKTEKSTLLLSQLCPALTRDWSEEETEGISKLLGLKPKGNHCAGMPRVFRFEKTVSVFVGAVRHPVLLSARLTDGGVRRVIVKSGERAHRQAAAMRMLAALDTAYAPTTLRTNYDVTILSDDCAIIEYLEDQVRLRSMVETLHPINDTLLSVQRAPSGTLILSPKSSLHHYQLTCSKTPATLLRSAIETFCPTTEDFIKSKSNFLESICRLSIATSLLGAGDRHLENILWSARDGAVCHVDWACALQYGARELPPARLTRNVLAVCDLRALEGKLQSLLAVLQQSHHLMLASFKVAFKCLGDEFAEKYPYFEGLLKSTSLFHEVTADAIRKCKQPYSEKYVELINEVFNDFPKKENYTVVDQISNLLRLSTEPRVLCVVRAGWEPWI